MKTKISIKIHISSKKGSILAYSLIIIAIMVAIAGSLSTASIIEKKASSGTQFSVQSLQTADSGVQMAIKKINAEISKSVPGNISTAFPSCDANGKYVGTDAGPVGSQYEITFLDATNTPLSCSSPIKNIVSIKSIGTYKGTLRAVGVALSVNSVNALKSVNTMLQAYRSTHPSYPVSTGWQGYCSAFGASLGVNWIPELASALPIDPRNLGYCWNNTAQYIYTSDGTNYKLISHSPASMQVPPELVDPTRPTWAWGWWTPGAASW